MISVEAKRSAAGSCANTNYPSVIRLLSPSSGLISSPAPLPPPRFLHCGHSDFVLCSPLYSSTFVFYLLIFILACWPVRYLSPLQPACFALRLMWASVSSLNTLQQ